MARIFIEGNNCCLNDSKEYKEAEYLGKKLAEKGYVIVSSARKGIAEAVFKGAMEEVEDSIRVAIDCPEINLPRNTKYTKEIIADNFFDMKMKNCINSDAFIFLTGSFSVLSNLSIILQLKELQLMGNKPLICVGEQLEEVINVFGFYNEDVLDISDNIIYAKTIDDAINKLENALKTN